MDINLPENKLEWVMAFDKLLADEFITIEFGFRADLFSQLQFIRHYLTVHYHLPKDEFILAHLPDAVDYYIKVLVPNIGAFPVDPDHEKG